MVLRKQMQSDNGGMGKAKKRTEGGAFGSEAAEVALLLCALQRQAQRLLPQVGHVGEVPPPGWRLRAGGTLRRLCRRLAGVCRHRLWHEPSRGWCCSWIGICHGRRCRRRQRVAAAAAAVAVAAPAGSCVGIHPLLPAWRHVATGLLRRSVD